MGNRCAERCTFSDAQQLYQLEKLGKLPRNFGGFLAFLIFKTGELGMQGGATRLKDVGKAEQEEDVRQGDLCSQIQTIRRVRGRQSIFD